MQFLTIKRRSLSWRWTGNRTDPRTDVIGRFAALQADHLAEPGIRSAWGRGFDMFRYAPFCIFRCAIRCGIWKR